MKLHDSIRTVLDSVPKPLSAWERGPGYPTPERTMKQVMRLEIETGREDELPRIDDAEIARSAVWIDANRLEASVFKDILNIELKLAVHLPTPELHSIACP